MRLIDRIKEVKPCARCRDTGDWVSDGAGVRRCDCLRGQLLARADALRGVGSLHASASGLAARVRA
jgi:hypothetical protein